MNWRTPSNPATLTITRGLLAGDEADELRDALLHAFLGVL